MRLTEAEKDQIQAQRNKTAARAAKVVGAHKRLASFVAALSDDQAVSLADQIGREYKRITGPAPECTCDSQWTNPNCPARRAGWRTNRGGPCEVPPKPVMHLEVDL